MKLSNLKAPNTFFIIFSVIVITAALTWLIPGGKFDTAEKNGRMVVIPGSFQQVESNPQGIADIFMAPLNGFVDAALIIGFVLIVGGVFYVLQATEAVDSAIKALAHAHHTSGMLQKLLIPIFMTVFSLAGAVFGMSEEIIPFILIFVPMALALGYDTVTGLAIPFIGAGAGFAGAFINPFTLGVAQGIAELPPLSGIEYRMIVWVVVTAVVIVYVARYARKVKAQPELSITYEQDLEKRKKLHLLKGENDFVKMTAHHRNVLLTFLAGILVMVYGVLQYGWYIKEIGAVFLITSFVVALVGRLTIKQVTDSFITGARDLVGTALIIALARGILVIASDGRIIDTMLNAMANVIGQLHPVVSAQSMFIVQTFINFFVPSGSGQAALTMPIMAPLADLVGVGRQTAVLAFQFGDGFSNMIIPTSAVTMGVLTLANIPWEKWARWILPLEVILLVTGLILLIPPVLLHWH
jgi:uncharacterized ion transporter superfamily protein YfcC